MRADPRGRCGTRPAQTYTRAEKKFFERPLCGAAGYPTPGQKNLRRAPDCAQQGVRISCIAVIVWIALVVWLGLVLWSLSVVRAAAGTDAPAPPPPPRDHFPAGRVPYAGRRRVMAVGQG